jgi:hypothetical protein
LGRVPILPFEKDAGLGVLGGLGGLFNRQDDDGTRMSYDITARPHTSGFFYFVSGDAENWTLVTDARREYASLR